MVETAPAFNQPPKPCIECGRLVIGSRCAACAPPEPVDKKERDRKHNADRKHYRTGTYRRAREAQLRAYPYCLACGSEHRLQCHHLDHDATNNDPHNLATLCETCHMKLEAEYQRGEQEIGRVHVALHMALENI